MTVLNTYRCHLCPNEITSVNSFELAREATQAGWLVLPTGRVFCPSHAPDGTFPDQSGAWLVVCRDCEWSTEDPDWIEAGWEPPLNKEEAEKLKLDHDCSDWRDFGDVEITSPEERVKRKTEADEYRQKFLAKQKEEEKEARAAADAAIREIEELTRDAEKWQMLVEVTRAVTPPLLVILIMLIGLSLAL